MNEAEIRDSEYECQLNKVHDSVSLVTQTPWLRHTRWERIFAGKDMKELVELTEIPKDDDELRYICDSVERVLRGCFLGVLDYNDRGWSLLGFWLNSVDRIKENTKPF